MKKHEIKMAENIQNVIKNMPFQSNNCFGSIHWNRVAGAYFEFGIDKKWFTIYLKQQKRLRRSK